jgi:hypothetical protein
VRREILSAFLLIYLASNNQEDGNNICDGVTVGKSNHGASKDTSKDDRLQHTSDEQSEHNPNVTTAPDLYNPYKSQKLKSLASFAYFYLFVISIISGASLSGALPGGIGALMLFIALMMLTYMFSLITEFKIILEAWRRRRQERSSADDPA